MTKDNSLIFLELIKNGDRFNLRGPQIIGRKEADIIVNDKSVSRRHALVESDGHIVHVTDLGSKNGTFINGDKIKKSPLKQGDILEVGDIELTFHDRRENSVTNTASSSVSHPVTNPTIGSVSHSVDHSSSFKTEGAIVGSNTVFDDRGFKAVDLTQTLRWDPRERDYIDLSEDTYSEKDIIHKKSQKASLEITVLVSGHVLSRDYIPFKKNGTYYLGRTKRRKTIAFASLHDQEKHCFIRFNSVGPHLMPVPGFTVKKLGKKLKDNKDMLPIKSNEILSLERGTMQLFVRHSTAPPSLKIPSLLSIEKRDALGAVLTSLLIVVLLSISSMIDNRPEELDEKKESIVYKADPEPLLVLMPKVKQNSSESSSRSPNKSKSPKRKNKKIMTKKAKRPSKRPTESKTAAKTPPKPKSYKSSKSVQNNLKNLFKSISANGAPRVVADSSSSTDSLTKVREVSGKGKGHYTGSSGKLSDSMGGGYDFSTGGRGLSGKKGVNQIGHATIKGGAAKGIDAELLARLLRDRIPQFKHCYQRELIRKKDMEGVISLNFRIGPTGSASKVSVTGQKISFSVQGNACIKRVLASIEFPRPPGGGYVDVKQPLDFSSLK